MSEPGFQIGIGTEVGVLQSTVNRTIHEVMLKVISKRNQWIVFPNSNASNSYLEHLNQMLKMYMEMLKKCPAKGFMSYLVKVNSKNYLHQIVGDMEW